MSLTASVRNDETKQGDEVMKFNREDSIACSVLAVMTACLVTAAYCPAGAHAVGCEAGTIGQTSPPDGTLDARSPYHPETGQLVGIGNPAERIIVNLLLDDPDALPAADVSCWQVCETSSGIYEPNGIMSVTYLGSDQYAVRLLRPITPNAATTVSYLGDPEMVITYISHPGNVDGSVLATATDVLYLIDLLNGAEFNDDGVFRQDIDRSGQFGGSDILGTIDLLNGVGGHPPQLLTKRPDPSTCDGVAGCGNGMVDAGEQCDPPDGITCNDQCLIIADDCCEGGGRPGCGNPFCSDCVCQADPYCCEITWDEVCAGSAVQHCADVCPCAE